MEPLERKRYSRQIILPEMGLAGQAKLKAARVLVIGAGGLGCPVLQYLTAAGVGTIGIVDDDRVELTNLHRQILYSADDLGKQKAIVAKERLSVLNPFVQFHIHVTRLDPSNAAGLLANYDVIVDGSDNFPTRYAANDACVDLDKPLVFGSILRFEGQVSVFNYRGGPTYRCLFPDAEEGDNCAEAGVIGILPGIVGTYMANEVIKLVCEIGEPLSGKLMLIDALGNTNQLFQFRRSAEFTSSAPFTAIPATLNGSEIQEMSLLVLENLLENEPDSLLLVDVREPYEYEADNLGGYNIPLTEIPENLSSFPLDKRIIFYCLSGKRSKIAAQLLADSSHPGPGYWVKQ